MRSEEILGAIGANYLDGQISRIWVDSKFCILDNMEYDSTGEYDGSSRLRFPLKTSLTVCVFCKSGKFPYASSRKTTCWRAAVSWSSSAVRFWNR